MYEMLGHRQAATQRTKDCTLRDPHIAEAYARVIGWHVEGPQILFDLHTGMFRRHKEAGDTCGVPIFTVGASKDHAVRGRMHSSGPHLFAIDAPAFMPISRLGNGSRLHMGGVRTMIGLGQPERHGSRSVQRPGNELPLLLRRAEIPKDQDYRMIPNDGVLVLQVVVQPQSFGSEMLAY